ncbi:MAG: ABC transporter permease subunit, partial [Candidatus Latescibacteria bacterium]|nr:ABC transporter permease subunit [bacterium]MBD3425037.1 ABC transporter permease subunit [Candidatus Latescibacterota bacterium]
MYRFMAYRVLRIIPLVIAISLITFTLLHLAPGGPAGLMTGNPRISDRDIRRIKDNMGLDDPLPVQYLRWFKSTFIELDFGTSYITGRPVATMILERLPATLQLMGTAFIIALAAGLLIGILSALNRGGLLDQIFSMVSVAGISIPVFWFGLMAILLFSVKLDILPAGGMGNV